MRDIRSLFRDKPAVSRARIDAFLEKHGFSTSRSVQRLDGNFTNLVLDVRTRSSGRVFLKIQFRQSRGFSLKTEFIATRVLQAAPGVPVSESIVYDGDREPLPFECLLIPREHGKPGVDYYRGASRAGRLRLGALLGETLARVHSQKCPKALRSENTGDLASWEATVRDAMFGDATLASSIEATLPELWDRLLAALHPAPEIRIGGGNVFLWGEPGLHNVFVDNGRSLRITNVHDFQSAGWGTATHDLKQVEGETVARPGSEYHEPGYLEAFRSSYQAAIEKPVAPLSAEEEKLLAIIKNIRGIRFFWDCGRLLHPRTPEFLGAAVSDLEGLQDVVPGR
ncbi:MAG: aminoglycoside phosphotransferase family protein [Candidatus Latescibacteria bacterium]|nr:aminoglycoside phosphotransferase family protein [Candidatus Latescibacterota bacterium]